MVKSIWIAWERQRRSVELAEAFGSELCICEERGLFRYIKCSCKTFYAVKKHRPEILFVQNPSLVLAVFSTMLLKPIFSIPVIVDRHSNFLLTHRKRCWLTEWLFNFLSYISIRYASLTIVTNDDLAHVVRVLGGRPYVLPDKIPQLKPTIQHEDDQQNKVLVISSFAEDEPVAEIIAAFKKEEMSSFSAFISGNSKKAESLLQDIPANITLTGFLQESDFVNLVFEADAVMVLTKMDYTLLCGCYEAISAEKPLITSDTAVLRQLFTGALFVANDPDSIAAGVQELFAGISQYRDNSVAMKKELTHQWNERFAELKNTLAAMRTQRTDL